MKTSLSAKGQIVLPLELRRQDHLRPGQEFAIERLDAGRYLLKKLPEAKNVGLLDWLLACPEKGWVERISSESTDTL